MTKFRSFGVGLRGHARLPMAIGITLAVLTTGSPLPANPAFAADTSEAQQKKARAALDFKRSRAMTQKQGGGCEFGVLLAVGVSGTGTTSDLGVVVFCLASNQHIWGVVRNEVRQETLAIALAAKTAGKHVVVDVDKDGWVTGFALAEVPLDP